MSQSSTFTAADGAGYELQMGRWSRRLVGPFLDLRRPDAWRLYRLHDLAAAPALFQLKPPLEAAVTLTAETWRVGF